MTTVMEAVAIKTTGVARIYALGSVPNGPAYPYGALSAELGRPGNYTMDARYALRWGRITVQTFGKTVDSATALMGQVVDRLLDVSLTVTNYQCGPCRLELDPAITRDVGDHGVIGVTASLVFIATKEIP